MTVSDGLTVHAVITCAVALLGGGAVFFGREWKAREVERERLAWQVAESAEGERFAVRHGWNACLPDALRRGLRGRASGGAGARLAGRPVRGLEGPR